MSTPIIVRRAFMSGQHLVETEAGSAVLTRIDTEGPRGGRVFDYEIETAFNGDRVRLHYGYASFAVAKRGAQLLADNYVAEYPARARAPHDPYPFYMKNKKDI